MTIGLIRCIENFCVWSLTGLLSVGGDNVRCCNSDKVSSKEDGTDGQDTGE